MSKPTRDVNVIVDNIISFLAVELGFDVRDEYRAELAARVEGHADLKTQETYDAKSKQALVYEFGLDDASEFDIVDGLTDTLSRPVLGTFDNFDKANEQAHEFATRLARRLARPIIVLSGNYSIQGVHDEPTPAGDDDFPYCIYRPMGLLNPRAPFANEEFSEDMELVDAAIKNLRYAVAVAKKVAQKASRDKPDSLVVTDGSRRIMWRSKNLRG